MHLRFLLPLSLLALPLPAQTEWVTNGSFTGALTPWVMGGAYSVNPGLETGWVSCATLYETSRASPSETAEQAAAPARARSAPAVVSASG